MDCGLASIAYASLAVRSTSLAHLCEFIDLVNASKAIAFADSEASLRHADLSYVAFKVCEVD